MSVTRARHRRLWFQVHKWIGLTLAVLIIPLCLTGSALVWHDWLDQSLNPERQTSARPALTPAAFAEAARQAAQPGETLLSLVFPRAEGPVAATLARASNPAGGRPSRTLLHLDPRTGRLLDRSASNTGAVAVMHVLHGTLMIPGVGRQIVGWIGVALLISSLSGLWLWWPLKGRFTRGLRWRRQPITSGNLHHQGGFWIALPLAVLSLTGAWISFPAFFAAVSGDPAPPPAAERARRMAAVPLGVTRLDASSAVTLANPLSGGPLTMIVWPTRPEAKWKITFAGPSGPREVQVEDGSGAVTPPRPPQPETFARLMRRLHDGSGMGPLWQAIIFVGGLIPAGLAVTGILMWLHARRRRKAMAARRIAPTADPVPA